MDTTNGWKVPIPVNIRHNESIDTLSRMLFFEIITLCQNKDTLLHFEHCDKWYSVELKRGQCVLKIAKVAKDLKIGHKRVRKSLEILSKWYCKMESKAMPFGLIITVIDYDSITQMERNGEDRGKVEGKYRESVGKVEGELIKNVKSVKSVESVKKVVHPPKEVVKKTYLEQLRDEKFIGLLKKEFPEVDLKTELRAMVDWIKANGNENKYKDYQAFARNWLRRTAKELKAKDERRSV